MRESETAAAPGPSDLRAPRFPVSIKGVVLVSGRVVLLRNERDEWELPGGKLEPGEEPMACVRREVREELALDVEPGEILDCWLYDIQGRVEVLVVTYGCILHGGEVTLSHEHKAVGLFSPGEIEELPMPEGYRRSIRRWTGHPAAREVEG
jgi:8-oxo-dGTP pyrophosphatase MutT (NUDIX family)